MAADQDHTEAQVSLGLLYAQGRGVEEDYQTAMDLLYAAALDGHPIAQVELANYFLYGVPDKVQQSESHAFDWYGPGILVWLRFPVRSRLVPRATVSRASVV